MSKKSKLQSTKAKKRAMLSAMEKTLANVTASTRTVGISRNAHYNWLKTDSKYKEQIEELAEVALDFVEAALMKKIQNGNTTAIIFHLKTKGKHRGYVETTHNLNTKVDRSDLESKTDEELMAIINRKV